MAARFDLFTLKLFAAVVEERSIARAAEREGIAASAVSKRISDLEQSLRVPLLVRMHRGVEATEAGRTLLLHARGILREMEELNAELAGHADGTRGQIRILTNETCIFSFLPEELRGFLKQHPQVRVELKVAVSLTIAQAVAENVADIGILTGGVATGDLMVVPYHKDRLVAVTPSGHPLAGRRSVRLADLLEHEIIDQERRSSISLMVLAGAARLGRPLRVRLRVESFDAMCRMVSAGLGIGIVPDQFAERLGKPLGLRSLRLDEPWAARQHRICTRDLSALPAPARLLVDHLARSAGSARRLPSRIAMAD
jgi:DNA-binding transcriptional LysR family regulator